MVFKSTPMTSQWMKKINRVHRKIFQEHGEEATQQKILRSIVKHGAKTTKDEYFNDLRKFGYINRVEGTDKYLIDEPEGLNTSTIDTDDRTQIHLEIPTELREMMNDHGINATQLLINSALDEMDAIEDFYQRHVEVEDISEEEIKYCLELKKRNLLRREGREEKRAQRQYQRHDLYEEFTGTNGVQCPKRVEELRKQAYKLRHA